MLLPTQSASLSQVRRHSLLTQMAPVPHGSSPNPSGSLHALPTQVVPMALTQPGAFEPSGVGAGLHWIDDWQPLPVTMLQLGTHRPELVGAFESFKQVSLAAQSVLDMQCERHARLPL